MIEAKGKTSAAGDGADNYARLESMDELRRLSGYVSLNALLVLNEAGWWMSPSTNSFRLGGILGECRRRGDSGVWGAIFCFVVVGVRLS